MGYTVNSIVINKKVEELFLIINNIENWPLLHGYQKAELIDKNRLVDGKLKIVFKVTGNTGEQEEQSHPEIWTSQRTINFTNYSARGVRLDPIYPFKHWILDVILTEEKDGTRMTWIQDFRMDEKTGMKDAAIEEHINKDSKIEMQIFKEKIESGAVYKKLEK